jgi:uncharacterized protein YkwD
MTNASASPRRALLLSLLAFSLLAAGPAQTARKGTAAPPATPPLPSSPAASKNDIILQINQERTRNGAPPFAPSKPLEQVAQAEADAIAARGALPTEAESFQLFNRMQMDLARKGYKAQGWSEGITLSAGSAAAVVTYWKSDPTYREAMRHDLKDIGVGVSSFGGIPLYTFLFAWPKSDYFARQTAPLKDLQAVREAMLIAVNLQRKAAGQPTLAHDSRLDEAAQKHAEDMLARIYYAHDTPEGKHTRDRVGAAGYEADTVGENIAAGHTDVEEVMDAWLHSPGHRRNLLDGRFTHLGIGVAVGSYEHRYQVLWVQDFASPALTALKP